VKSVLYNRGGFVAHLAVKLHTKDSFEALVHAAALALENEGQVERLYDDVTPSRASVGGVERAGLVLEFGTLDDDFELERQAAKAQAAANEAQAESARLREAAEHVLRHGKLGKQSARRLRDALPATATTTATQSSPEDLS
jgi:hypothetical protein